MIITKDRRQLTAASVREALRSERDRLFRYDMWNVGIVNEPIGAFLESNTADERDIIWFPRLRRGMYLADPFGIPRDGKIFVFCETYDYRSLKGVISCVELSEDGQASPPKLVLRLPFHVSYPYLVEYRGDIYCVPETAEGQEVGLYKAENFPYEWKKVRTLISGVAGIDNTIFRKDGRWWLMCTDLRDHPNLKLHVWYASDLLGPWKPHERNPVKVDRGSARPAGTPFTLNEQLYRPAQDSSRTYGGRVVIQRMIRLTPAEFEETTAAAVEPSKSGPYPDGLHTVSAVGDMTLIDGKRTAFFRSGLKSGLRESARWRFPKLADSIWR